MFNITSPRPSPKEKEYTLNQVSESEKVFIIYFLFYLVFIVFKSIFLIIQNLEQNAHSLSFGEGWGEVLKREYRFFKYLTYSWVWEYHFFHLG